MIPEENKKEYSGYKLFIYFAIFYLKTFILYYGLFTTQYLILYFSQWKSLLFTPLWLISHDNLSQGFPGGSDGKKSACNAADPGSFPGLGRSLEKCMATHSSILAWKIPWTKELGWATAYGVSKSRMWLTNA